MGAIASLESQLISVAPGAEASVQIKVRNNGSVVDQMTISVLGGAADWSGVEPATLSLFPGAEGTATITFRPPRSSTVPAGQMPFGARVASQEDPAGSVVEEGRLDIAAFSEIGAELQPLTSRGARGARHDLAVDNRGNVALNANISGLDDSEEVSFDIKPPSVVADPGQASFAQIEVKPRKRFWRGQPKSRAFTLQVEAANQAPVPVTGTFLQEPVLPSWFVKGLVGLAALLIALLVLWFLILKPTLLTAAEDRAEEAAAQVLTDAGFPPAGGGGGDNGGGGTPEPGDPATPPSLLVGGDPVAARIRADRNPTPVRPSQDKTLFVTDLVFSNPDGESGPVRLRRNGESLLSLRLENFRDLDFHFVTAIVVGPDDEMDLWCAECSNAAVFYSGYER